MNEIDGFEDLYGILVVVKQGREKVVNVKEVDDSSISLKA